MKLILAVYKVAYKVLILSLIFLKISFLGALDDRASAGSDIARPDLELYYRVQAAEHRFVIQRYFGDLREATAIIDRCLTDLQRVATVAMLREDNRAYGNSGMLPIGDTAFDAVAAAVAARSVTADSLSAEPDDWVASVPADLTTLFEDAPQMPVASRGGGRACSGHASRVRARRAARVYPAHQVGATSYSESKRSESKYNESADSESKIDDYAEPVSLEDMTPAQLLAYNFPREREQEIAQLPRFTE